MIKALFRKDGVEQLLSVNEIEENDARGGDYRNHLFCSEAGCPARIQLSHRDGKPYLRTWKNEQHSPGCQYKFYHDPNKLVERAELTLATAVSPQHKRRALQNAIRRRKEANGELPVRSRSSTGGGNKRPTAVAGGVRRVASLDPNAEAAPAKEREASLLLRDCQELRPKDIGKSLTVYGRVDRAEITENSVHLYFDTAGGKTVQILFFTPFQVSNPQAYQWITEIAGAVSRGALPNLQVACVSSCAFRGGRWVLQVMDELSLYVGDVPIAAFMRDWRPQKRQ